METLDAIWNYVLPIGGGITIGAIIAFVATLIIKSSITKIASKLNIEKIEDKAVNKGVEKVKEISFKQSIEPIAKSELKKITEEANDYIKESLEQVHTDYQKIVLILQKFSAYFDNSIAITEEKKQELKNLIDETLEETPVQEQEIVIEESAKEEEKIVEKTKVER